MTSRLLSFFGGRGAEGGVWGGEKGGGRQIPKGLPTGPTPRAGRYALFPIRTPSTMLRLHHYRITRVFQAPSSIFPQCWGDTGQAAAVPQDGQRQDNTLRWEETTDEGLQLIAFALYVCVCLR